jgi:hypothetical protein
MRPASWALAALLLSLPLCPATPSGLLVSFKPTPALSVPLTPAFTWAVPPSPTAADAAQAAYRLLVWRALGSASLVWDSGRVASNASVSVPYGGPALNSSTLYLFTVTTYLTDAAATAAKSPPAAFTTALAPSDWAPGASFVWPANASAAANASSSTFALIRREVTLAPGGSPIALALLHASAQTGDDTILCGYKVYIEGALVGVGPGRGEARVWGGDGAFRSLPYATYNVTSLLPLAGGSSFTLGAAGVGAWFSATRGVLLQLDLHRQDGTVTSIATGGANSSTPFAALSGDAYYVPTQPLAKAATAYRPVHEYTDARLEPVGWLASGFAPSPAWAPAAATLQASAPEAAQGLTPKMAANVEVVPAAQGAPAQLRHLNASAALADFGAEFQGGLALEVGGAGEWAGARVTLVAGESLAGDAVGSTWGYNFTWTLRAGAQVIEQLQYMEFRFVSLVVEGVPLEALTLRAWRVAAAWDDSLSAFSSPNATLNAVWAQSRYTQRAGLLDTYTDSNTRERRVYECDGMITASGRLLVQGDVAWVRHSHSYVFTHPTWPVEWLQMTPLLALQDYWATGSADLAAAYLPLLAANTHYAADVDATGLLNTSLRGARHIVDWDPWPTHARYHQSQHLSVTQFFALAGLRALAALAGAAGAAAAARDLAAQAAALQAAVQAQLYSNAAGLFCDGVCSDPAVAGFASPISSAWALCTGAAAGAGAGAVAAAWAHAAAGGLEGYGSYGGFMYLCALAAAGPGQGDDGAALLAALTKCDDFSWCGEMARMNATMTRESWTDPTATYSHAWGTGPLVGIAQGLMGVRASEPAWGAFTVAPRLGSLGSAELLLPTLRGPLRVAANGSATVLHAPCGARALLCLAPSPLPPGGLPALRLLLDGVDVTAGALLFPPWHACVRDVGCGPGGAPRVLVGAGAQ